MSLDRMWKKKSKSLVYWSNDTDIRLILSQLSQTPLPSPEQQQNSYFSTVYKKTHRVKSKTFTNIYNLYWHRKMRACNGIEIVNNEMKTLNYKK